MSGLPDASVTRPGYLVVMSACYESLQYQTACYCCDTCASPHVQRPLSQASVTADMLAAAAAQNSNSLNVTAAAQQGALANKERVERQDQVSYLCPTEPAGGSRNNCDCCANLLRNYKP